MKFQELWLQIYKRNHSLGTRGSHVKWQMYTEEWNMFILFQLAYFHGSSLLDHVLEFVFLCPKNIPLYQYAAFCSSVHLLMGTWLFSHFCYCEWHCQEHWYVSVWILYFILWGIRYPRSRMTASCKVANFYLYIHF